MGARTPLPPELGASFTVEAARRLAVSEGRLRGRDLLAPFHGIRAQAGLEEDDPRPEARQLRRARMYAPRLAAGSAFCGPTALAVWGLPMPAVAEPDLVHVNVPAGDAPPRAAGVRGHRYALGRPMTVRGLPVVPPIAAWLQCATAPLDDLVIIGDALVRRVDPLSGLVALREAVGRAVGRRGARRLREAVALVRPRTDSPGETRLRLRLVRAGLPEPEVNAPIVDAGGAFLGFGDLVFRRERLVLEYEGEYHFASAAQSRHDLDRLASFVRAGHRVIRVHRELLRDRRLLEDVAAALAAA